MGAIAAYDCMLFLQAASRPDRVHGTFRLVADGTVTLCVSPTVLAEIRDVLTRPELRAKFPALRPEHVRVFLDHVLASARLIDPVPDVFTLPRDPKDEPYVNLAIAAGARYLVTWNERHLTYLMRGDTPEGAEFRQRFPELTILTPPEFIRALSADPEGGRST